MANVTYSLYIDSTDLQEKMKILKDALSQEGFERMMQAYFNELSRRCRKIIWTAIKEEYVPKRDFVYSAIKYPKISGTNCIIPIQGPRGKIGKDYSAAGGAHGWRIRKYRVRSKIVTAGQSILPPNLASYGGQPPFRNLSWQKMSFTRDGKARLPIRPVTGIAVPQMPLNRSENETANKILELAEKRLDHYFQYMFRG